MRPEDGARKGTGCGRFTLNSKNELIETALGRAPPPQKRPQLQLLSHFFSQFRRLTRRDFTRWGVGAL